MIFILGVEKSENTLKKRSWPIGVGFIDYSSNVQNAPTPTPHRPLGIETMWTNKGKRLFL
jgi:hypothetical protein